MQNWVIVPSKEALSSSILSGDGLSWVRGTQCCPCEVLVEGVFDEVSLGETSELCSGCSRMSLRSPRGRKMFYPWGFSGLVAIS